MRLWHFFLVLAALYPLFTRYWVYIPALIDWLKYPLPGPNQEVIWDLSPSHFINQASGRPNIIVILADDLGFNDITFYGGGFEDGMIPTPNIDSIGKNGIAFTNAYAGHSTCAPSRAALLTGKYPTKVGYEFTPSSDWAAWVLGNFMNIGPLKGIYHSENAKSSNETFSFPTSHPLISEALKDFDYTSIQIGKWHNGYDSISAPINRGFSHSLGFNLISSYLPSDDYLNSVNCYFEDTFDRLIWANVRYAVKLNNGRYFKPTGYLTDYLADETAKAITANKNNPFFMYVALSSIHTPLQALRTDFEDCQTLMNNTTTSSDSHCRCVYGGMILALDRAVGKILQAIEANDLTENTIVIFSSDNGGTNLVNQPEINKPYRGWKATFFEGGLRVPLLLKWPRYIFPNQVHRDVVSHVDIFPTILHAAESHANISEPPRQHNELDGVSIWPFIIPDTNKDPVVVSEEPIPRSSQSVCDFKARIHPTLFWRSGHYMAMRHCEWKIKVSSLPKKIWLYHLVDDPLEQINQADNPTLLGVKDQLLEILMEEDRKQIMPLWNSLSETPLLVDKVFRENYVAGDEYIYWPN